MYGISKKTWIDVGYKHEKCKSPLIIQRTNITTLLRARGIQKLNITSQISLLESDKYELVKERITWHRKNDEKCRNPVRLLVRRGTQDNRKRGRSVTISSDC